MGRNLISGAWGVPPKIGGCRGAKPPCRRVRGVSPRPFSFFPTPVPCGSTVLQAPTRGRVSGEGNSPPILFLWGDTPHFPPSGGLRPPAPLVFLLRGGPGGKAPWQRAWGMCPQRLGGAGGRSPHARGLRGGSPRFFSFSHPRLLRLSLASASHSWPGFRRRQLAPNFVFVGGRPPLPPVRGTESPCTPRFSSFTGVEGAVGGVPPRETN